MSQQATHPSGAHSLDIAVLAHSVSVDLKRLIEEYRVLPRNKFDARVYSGIQAFFRRATTGDFPVDVVKSLDQALVDGESCVCPFTGITLSDYSAIHLRRALRLLWKNEGIRPTLDLIGPARERLRSSGRAGRFSGQLLAPYIRKLLAKIPCPSLYDLQPKHGPGAVACGEQGLEKWSFDVFFEQWLGIADPTLFHFNDHHWLSQPHCLELVRHPVTRVIQVPKDVRGDRVISIEPKEMMFLQQGLCEYLMPRLERASNGEIKFSSQDAHKSVLREHGLNVATLDLKDASDLVSRRLVWNAFPKEWRVLLFALRSRYTATNAEDTVSPVRAYAPMGSALCFVVESIVHWAACKLGIAQASENSRSPVSVYGDDLIVPANAAPDVMRTLRVCGLRPNISKCCVRGQFRETCGLDAFWHADGSYQDATCVYIRADLKHFRVCDIPGLIQQANALYRFGMENVAYLVAFAVWLDDKTSSLVYRGPDKYHIQFPCGAPLAPTRYNHALQRLEHKVLQLKLKGQVTEAPDGWVGLMSGLRSQFRASKVSYAPSRLFRVNCRWGRASEG